METMKKKKTFEEWYEEHEPYILGAIGGLAGIATYSVLTKIDWKIKCKKYPAYNAADMVIKNLKNNHGYKVYSQTGYNTTIGDMGKLGETMLDAAKGIPCLNVDSTSEVVGLIACVK